MVGREQLLPFVSTGGIVIDVGGGTGFNAELLSVTPDRYIAVDFSEIGLAQVVDKRRGHAVASDAGSLPFRDGQFSSVLCSWSLEHFEKPELILTEMLRVVRANGRIIIWGPNWDNIFRKDFPQFRHKSWWHVQRVRWLLFLRMIANEFLPFRYRPYVNTDVAAFHDPEKYIGGDADATHCVLCQETTKFFESKGMRVVHLSDFSEMTSHMRNTPFIRHVRTLLKPLLPILRRLPLVRWFVLRFPLVVEKR